MPSKLDRRKKYTRMMLKESLITLMKEKSISMITIKEICEKADINRSTFYSHYSDQYDLLHQIEEEIIKDMNETLMKFDNNVDDEAQQMIMIILEYIAANKDICEILLSDNGDASFQQRVMMVAHEYTVKSWMANDHFKEDISQYLSVFTISGSIMVIKTWLKNGLNNSPKEMAEVIMKVTKKGISSFQS